MCFWSHYLLVRAGAKTRLEFSIKTFNPHLIYAWFAGSGQGAANDVWTGAVDIVVVNVVDRSVSHTLTWVVRTVYCVVVNILT